MSKRGKKRPRTESRGRKAVEARDQARMAAERELRTSITVSVVVYASLWLIILIIAWSKGWLGPGQ